MLLVTVKSRFVHQVVDEEGRLLIMRLIALVVLNSVVLVVMAPREVQFASGTL